MLKSKFTVLKCNAYFAQFKFSARLAIYVKNRVDRVNSKKSKKFQFGQKVPDLNPDYKQRLIQSRLKKLILPALPFGPIAICKLEWQIFIKKKQRF